MKQKYIVSSYPNKHYLEQLSKKDGSESKTYIVKTDSEIIRTGKTNEGHYFIDLSGGPMIVVGKPLIEAEGAIVRSIDTSDVFGFTVTFQ